MQGRSGQAGRGLIRHRGIRLGTARQVRLVLVRPVALRFVGNGQGKAGLAGKASFVELRIGELRPGKAGWVG